MDPFTAILIVLGVLWLANSGGATIPVTSGGYSYGSGYGSGGYSSYPEQGGGNVTSGDAFVLAQTIYGEARGATVQAGAPFAHRADFKEKSVPSLESAKQGPRRAKAKRQG